MNNFKLGRGYINNSIHNINVGEINPNDVEWFTNRLRQVLRIPMDYHRREIRHQFHETIRVEGLNNTMENNINP